MRMRKQLWFWLTILLAAAALVAITLLGVQLWMGAFCPFCAVVDVSAIGLFVLAMVRWQRGLDPPPGARVAIGSVALLVVAAGVPLAIGFGRRLPPLDIPGAIAEEMRRTGKGKVTVVDFADFECPYCRSTHGALAPLLESRRAKLRLVRVHVPLRIHRHALDAAKAGCCAENLGKGPEMADALFTAPVEELTPDGCEKLAAKVGLDLERFRACVGDPATQARIDRDRETYRAAKCNGLPTIFVDGVRLEGAQERETLEATLDAAIGAL